MCIRLKPVVQEDIITIIQLNAMDKDKKEHMKQVIVDMGYENMYSIPPTRYNELYTRLNKAVRDPVVSTG